MHIASLSGTSSEALHPLLQGYRYKPYWYISDVAEEGRLTLIQQEIDAIRAAPVSILLGAYDQANLLGFVAMHKLGWDTAHYGIEIARLDHLVIAKDMPQPSAVQKALLEAAIDEAKRHGIRLIHAWMPMDELQLIQLMELMDFRLADVQALYTFNFLKDRIRDWKDDCIIREFQPGDLDHLVEMARTSYTLDRFHGDPWLDREKSDDLHAQWIRNSCLGQIADHVVVAEVDGKPVGYTTSVCHGDYGGSLNLRIGGLILSAVAPTARGRGCYTSMINATLKWLSDKADIAYLGTQVNNYAVQKAWATLGFKIVRAGASLSKAISD